MAFAHLRRPPKFTHRFCRRVFRSLTSWIRPRRLITGIYDESHSKGTFEPKLRRPSIIALTKFAINFIILHFHVICRPSSSFSNCMTGTENRTRNGVHVFVVGNTGPKQQCLPRRAHIDEIICEIVPNTALTFLAHSFRPILVIRRKHQ